MAIGKAHFPEIPVIAGLKLGAATAGVKPGSNRHDLALIALCEGAKVAGVFTKNAFCAEPVKICREHMAVLDTRYLLINSGNANACTGIDGRKAALNNCQQLSSLIGSAPESVLPFSTGVIGQPLPFEKINAALPQAIENLSENNWVQAAEAIMTTDTRPKGVVEEVETSAGKVTIAGIAKGSGMIKPNMATMLSYIATDACVDKAVLQDVCEKTANCSFNRITVDGDTSTNDSYMLIATGKGPVAINAAAGSDYEAFFGGVKRVAQQLALEMLRDAEGATKVVTVRVNGGASPDDCLKVASAICHSPLVKTALFACDPNWGRIVAAIGYAGVENLHPEMVSVFLDEVLIVENGACATSYSEEQGQSVFDKAEFSIVVELGMGNYSDALWTTDLSHDYVRINAEYRS